MNRLEEAPARFEPPSAGRAAEEVQPRRLGRVLARSLARLGPFLDGLRGVTVSLAVVALLFVVGWSIVAETRRIGIVVDRIEVPRSREERGLRSEVLASRSIDAIAETSAAAFWRGERKAAAAGWKTADVQVPALGVTTSAIVRMVEEFVERPDQRVGGEIVQLDRVLTLRSQITPPRANAEPIVLPTGPAADDETAIDTVLGEASRRLLERLDPVALAAHRLASRLERLPSEAGPGEALEGLQAVVAAFNVCLVDARCRENDGARARLIWATATWRAAHRIRGRDPETTALLVEEGLGRLDRAALPGGDPLPEAMLGRADLLLGRWRTGGGVRLVRTGRPRAPRCGRAAARLGQGASTHRRAGASRGGARGGDRARAARSLALVRARKRTTGGRSRRSGDRGVPRGDPARRAPALRLRGMGAGSREHRPRLRRPTPSAAGRAAAGIAALLHMARPLIAGPRTLYRERGLPRSPRWPTRHSSTTTPTSAASSWM